MPVGAGAAAHRVRGEAYAVTARGLARLDELEGVATGHYERLPVAVDLEVEGDGECGGEGGAEGRRRVEDAIAYFAHRSYAGDLWRRSGEEGVPGYTHGVAAGAPMVWMNALVYGICFADAARETEVQKLNRQPVCA